jgi:hypothetical protein
VKRHLSGGPPPLRRSVDVGDLVRGRAHRPRIEPLVATMNRSVPSGDTATLRARSRADGDHLMVVVTSSIRSMTRTRCRCRQRRVPSGDTATLFAPVPVPILGSPR